MPDDTKNKEFFAVFMVENQKFLRKNYASYAKPCIKPSKTCKQVSTSNTEKQKAIKL